MQDQLRNAKDKVVGLKQTVKALEKGEALMVFIARDAEEKVSRPVVALCEASGVELHYVDTMLELGKMCGIKVKAATAAVTGQS
ncbi:MAG: ribosomal L7Ae/L30e/S12e/Gadd45 family protein [Dethiobacter sp.]|nr:ribosomal L7Ae/L30e/S12e/Gadd45 family protein [Dethiobacter sp.]